MTDQYNIIAESNDYTVVARYEPLPIDLERHQSEDELEAILMKQLSEQGYETPDIRNEKDLVANLRVQLEKLNNIKFSDNEWQRFLTEDIADNSKHQLEKTEQIQLSKYELHKLERDNGTQESIILIDKANIHNNTIQAIHQYVSSGGKKNRYDVTILVNGLPLVHIELKQRGGDIREAFKQVCRYERESFWSGMALFEYVQIYVVSNGTFTKYYSNTTRFNAEKAENERESSGQRTDMTSFEFTCFWSDADNNVIRDLVDFTATFLKKDTLLNVITKYCVYTVDKKLMVMRPYQIAATERILRRIKMALNNRWQGSLKGGGYIWHTTGSGKTLTSFKTAQLATNIKGIAKVLFVVDRQDLDYQTMKEYDNFEKDCANGNTNWSILYRQLCDEHSNIIITTIQKLSNFLKRDKDNKGNHLDKSILDKNVVMIFDECHRSQFGDMHKLIVKKFKKYMMFGFTGTPIFPENATKQGKSLPKTTADLFGGELDMATKNSPCPRFTKPLHTYTIVNAINDKNVLKFKIDYIRTMKIKDGVVNEKVNGIDEPAAFDDPRRIHNVVEYILKNFSTKTLRTESYVHKVTVNVDEVVKDLKRKKNDRVGDKKEDRQVKGFNSILACGSVKLAIDYYNEFKKQQAKLPESERLRIATIFTYAANEEENNPLGIIEEDPNNVEALDATSKDFLDRVIKEDYNTMFGMNYDTSAEKFPNYYKDLSLRMKNKEIDILIVVGMFLTGFDAKTLNTLWVDKNLKQHGLLQAYSRTNRILNNVKDYGNIVCFRNLRQQTDDSLRLFGDKDSDGIVFIRSFEDYYNGYTEGDEYFPGYKELAEALLSDFPLSGLGKIIDENKKKAFVKLFSQFLRKYNLLLGFDQFHKLDIDEQNEVRIIKEGELQQYRAWYNELYTEFRGPNGEKTDITDDLVFEMELIAQVQVNISYILALIKKYKESHCKDKELVERLINDIKASPDMRDKLTLILNFIERVTPASDIDVVEDWFQYVNESREKELAELIETENLKVDEARAFIEQSLADGKVEENGTAIVAILPPMPLFGAGNLRSQKKTKVVELIKAFVKKYRNI